MLFFSPPSVTRIFDTVDVRLTCICRGVFYRSSFYDCALRETREKRSDAAIRGCVTCILSCLIDTLFCLIPFFFFILGTIHNTNLISAASFCYCIPLRDPTRFLTQQCYSNYLFISKHHDLAILSFKLTKFLHLIAVTIGKYHDLR